MAQLARSESAYIARSIQPSAISTTVCLLMAGLLTFLNFVSIKQRTADADSLFVINYLLRPWHALTTSSLFNTILTALLWGAMGLLFFFFVQFIMSIRNIRANQKDLVAYSSEGLEPKKIHNYEQVFRLGVLIIGILLLIALRPVAHYLTNADYAEALKGSSLIRYTVQHLVGWFMLIHIVVILIRLLSKRTRVFGEILT